MCKERYKVNRKIILNILLIVVLVLGILFALMFKVVKVEGDSMYPKLSDGQLVLISKNYDEINKNDIVVFKTDDGYAIKRVIAVPTDEIVLDQNTIHLNGIKLSPFTYDGEQKIEYNLNESEYFVVGDNYKVSYDSRDFGPIDSSKIIGKLVDFN